jgi:trehalose 6-phosphate phosphatase
VDEKLIIRGRQALERFMHAAAGVRRQTALLCDIDGTISPIAPRPDAAVVPDAAKDVLAALVDRLGLVAFISGRALQDARRMIPLDGAAYVGAHGVEMMEPGGEARIEPQAEPYLPLLRDAAAQAARDLDCERLGIVIEEKSVGFALHYRLAPDPDAARHEILARVIQSARHRGLEVMTGHFAFEVRPPVPLTKGTATHRLLDAGDCIAALVCGDDLTDVAAFDAAHQWGDRDARRTACALAAVTHETPQPVMEAADTQVCATLGVIGALEDLLAAVDG